MYYTHLNYFNNSFNRLDNDVIMIKSKSFIKTNGCFLLVPYLPDYLINESSKVYKL